MILIKGKLKSTIELADEMQDGEVQYAYLITKSEVLPVAYVKENDRLYCYPLDKLTDALAKKLVFSESIKRLLNDDESDSKRIQSYLFPENLENSKAMLSKELTDQIVHIQCGEKRMLNIIPKIMTVMNMFFVATAQFDQDQLEKYRVLRRIRTFIFSMTDRFDSITDDQLMILIMLAFIQNDQPISVDAYHLYIKIKTDFSSLKINKNKLDIKKAPYFSFLFLNLALAINTENPNAESIVIDMSNALTLFELHHKKMDFNDNPNININDELCCKLVLERYQRITKHPKAPLDYLFSGPGCNVSQKSQSLDAFRNTDFGLNRLFFEKSSNQATNKNKNEAEIKKLKFEYMRRIENKEQYKKMRLFGNCIETTFFGTTFGFNATEKLNAVNEILLILNQENSVLNKKNFSKAAKQGRLGKHVDNIIRAQKSQRFSP